MNRRTFISNSTNWALGAMALPSITQRSFKIPYHLEGYEKLYNKSPNQAALQWFQDVKLGLFVHFGLYSLDGIHPFEQHRFKIPVKEYEQKMQRFTAKNFDPDYITYMAKEAGFGYITLVAKHCEGFCLWDTKQTDFNSLNTPAQRDFVAEFKDACKRNSLGLFLFYEHGFDWRHPDGPRKKDFPIGLTEVQYDDPRFYDTGEAYNLNKYVEYVYKQIGELLTNYGDIAGIWLDGISVPLSGDYSKFQLPALYDLIHKTQTHALVSYKYGVTGTEDFLAPEYIQLERTEFNKPTEMCYPLNKGWGYVSGAHHSHLGEVLDQLQKARSHQANFLLNIGPLPNGSVYAEDVKTISQLGRYLKRHQSLLN